MKVLEVENLRAYYEKALILRDVSVDVGKRETVAILGPNGAGKTTLLKSIVGLVKTEGKIKFNGEDLTGLKPHERIRKGISICQEGRRLFPDMTIEDNLRLGAARKDCDDELEFVYSIFPELKKRRNHIAKMASGGEQQMAAIGRALMAKPKLLLMDEPSMGLAPIAIWRIRDAIKKIQKETETQILIVEQNIRLAFDLADRVNILIKGEIVERGTADSLKSLEKRYFELL
ncbi:MAG: branched-chain amino acid ABC transporter ATP-binding protein [Candidatus Hecatellales archaeon]|nr:MAG: branched-chain amino acid ABC transporter ATP-binding protein [Candidatus Hecatellales archaeon]